MPTNVSYVPINPQMLRWARERCALAQEYAAEKIHVDAEKIQDWERGTRQPTAKQARSLAGLYDVPFLELFSKAIPPLSKPKHIPDFRSFGEQQSPRSKFLLGEVQVWAEENRLNALDLLDLIGDVPPKLPKDLKASVDQDCEHAAALARKILGFSAEQQMDLKSAEKEKLPQTLRSKFEAVGVLVLRRSGLNKLGVRGICIFNSILPIVVFNNDESPGSQAFTLAHELGHIMLQQSGVSGQPRMGGKTGLKQIESWCNQFSASFLMPKSSLSRFMNNQTDQAESISDFRLEELARTFSVSRHAMLIRLVTLGYVKASFYWGVKRRQFIEEEAKRKSFRRARYYGQRYLSSRGEFYTRLVIEAWNLGKITNHNAAEYMGASKLSQMQDIRADLR